MTENYISPEEYRRMREVMKRGKDTKPRTHTTCHHACDCREEHFRKLEAENKRLREALEYMASLNSPIFQMDACDSARVIDHVRKALGDPS